MFSSTHARRRLRHIRQRGAVWLALGAIVFAALAPTLSHALAAAAGSDRVWAEVCTAAGGKLVKLADDGSTPLSREEILR